MRLKVILNRAQRFKGFVYGKAEFVGEAIMVHIVSRKNSRPICGDCGTPGPTYDHMPTERVWEHIPIWGFRVNFAYRERRVDCKSCGRVVVERVPWSDGNHSATQVFRCFLANWAKALSWKEVSRRFRTSWQMVFRSVKYVVSYGLAHRDLSHVTAIGVDEIQTGKGHKYVTAVYQIDKHRRRLLWIGKERREKTFRRFFADMEKCHEGFQKAIRFVCSDMWKPYLNAVADLLENAVHILDRFHIMQHFSRALDKIRAAEYKRLKAQGKAPVLKKTRWCLLKRPSNLTEKQRGRLDSLLTMNLRTTRAYLLKEQFQLLWEYKSPCWAGRFLDTWCRRAMRSRLEPIKKIARSMREHRELVLNWFRAKKAFNSGIVEANNNKFKLTIKKAFGFRAFETLEIAALHQLGDLPEPQFTHSFW